MRVVLDTNVLISGLLSPHGTTGRVVDVVLAGQLVLLTDDRIFAEYAEVVGRARFGFRAEDVTDVLNYLRTTAERVSALPLGVDLPDLADLPFLEVAVAGGADVLVTGNTRDDEPTGGRHEVRVMTPAQFLTKLGGPS